MQPINAKPCPFCGTQAIWTGKTIKCTNDDCPTKPKTAWWDSIDLALRAWNRRSAKGETK